MKNDFVHLHCHSDASQLDGCMKIEEMCKLAHEYDMPGVAITDHGVMGNSFHLAKECEKYNLNPIIGCEFYLSDKIGQVNESGKRLDRSGTHLIVLAKNKQGYKNICKLNYLSFVDGYYYRPKISKEWLFQNKKGLIVTTACLAHEVNQLLLANKDDEAYEVIEKYVKEFGDDFYFEIQINELKDQIKVNEKLIKISESFPKNKMILTGDIHYPYKGDCDLQDLLIHINRRTTIETKEEDTFYIHARNLFLMQKKDFLVHNEKFGYNYSEKNIEKYLNNTLEINDKCNFRFDTGKLNFPVFDVNTKGENILVDKVLSKFKEYQRNKIIPYKGYDIKVYAERVQYELDAIVNNGYSDYFLILDDLCEYARNNNIPKGAARGSSASSLISYLLDITNLDPIRFNLYFERFMGGIKKQDVRTPDIDIDFDSDRKDELEKYLIEKYGRDKVAHVVTNSTFHIKAILKDLTRVLAKDKKEIDFINKIVPEGVESISKYFENLKKIIINKDTKSYTKNDKRIFEWINNNSKLIYYADRLNGQLRHYGKHACAVVITPEPIYNYIPVNKVKGELVTGFQESNELKELQQLGLLKIDILGLNNVSIIDNTINLIKQTQNKDITNEIKNIDLDNDELYKDFAKGKNHFIFQFSGDGINKLIKASHPDCFEDVCAINSLYRPANLSSKTAWEYAKCKKDKSLQVYLHDKLIPILKNTYSILCYQEQVMQICHDIAGFSWVDSDKARKVLDRWNNKKTTEKEREKFKKSFINGCKENGIDEKSSLDILNWLIQHVGYSFNKCLSGDCIIEFDNGDKKSIDEINSDDIGRYIKTTSNNENITYNKLMAKHINGKKHLYKIYTKNGKHISCSLDHKIMTNKGLKTLKQILKNNYKILICD
jgi:DNA polymerase-3 subunit alpha